MSHSIVLIVEDEPLVRLVLRELLSFDGYEVLEAQNAHEALDELRSRDDISAVITDVRMPGAMNGIDLTRVIAAEWPHIRVLVVSGYLDTLDTALPPLAAFIRKPYHYEAVKAHLELSG